MKKQICIAVLTHWRTGSTLLRRVLSACGMVNLFENYPHFGDINGIGSSIYHDRPIMENPKEGVSNILKRFRTIAKQKKFPAYGIKSDHTLQLPCWNVMRECFFKQWPDAQYVISVRHPAGIWNSILELKKEINLDPDFTIEDVAKSWLSTQKATYELLQANKATLVFFPDDFLSGRIKRIVEGLGLSWTEQAGLFDLDQVNKTGQEEKEKFDREFPEASEFFYVLGSSSSSISSSSSFSLETGDGSKHV